MTIQIIAELGINHGGDYTAANRMIHAAHQAGCGGVKIQTYRAEDFLPRHHPDWDMFKQCEIFEYIDDLASEAHDLDLAFGTTPTSLVGVQEAAEAGCDFLKNGSDFLLRTDMIQAMIATGLPTWVSTGMATKEEIGRVPHPARLMLCTSLYPCPDNQAHLSRLWNEDEIFDGFSDHTRGTHAAQAAAAAGVTMIEKHFTLDKNAAGPDHAWSANPKQMRRLTRAVRRIETLMGDKTIGYTPGEQQGRNKWRIPTEGAVRR